jgi:hypothetical protein
MYCFKLVYQKFGVILRGIGVRVNPELLGFCCKPPRMGEKPFLARLACEGDPSVSIIGSPK